MFASFFRKYENPGAFTIYRAKAMFYVILVYITLFSLAVVIDIVEGDVVAIVFESLIVGILVVVLLGLQDAKDNLATTMHRRTWYSPSPASYWASWTN